MAGQKVFKVSSPDGSQRDILSQRLYSDSKYKDLEIVCSKNSRLWCHQAIISMAVPLFKSAMTIAFDEGVRTLILPQFSAAAVAIFLKLCYCLDLDVRNDGKHLNELQELLQALNIKKDFENIAVKEEDIEIDNDTLVKEEDIEEGVPNISPRTTIGTPQVRLKRLTPKCLLCDKKSGIYGQYRVSDWDKVMFNCDTCVKKMKRPHPGKSLLKPKIPKKELTIFRCNVCRKLFEVNGLVQGQVPCPYCPKKVVETPEATKSLLKPKEERLMPCHYICNSAERVSIKSLDTGVKEKSQPAKGPPEPSGVRSRLRCNICNGMFKENGVLAEHRPCQYCPERVCDMAHHLRYHREERPYGCGLCSFKALTLTAINRHKIWHEVRLEPSKVNYVPVKKPPLPDIGGLCKSLFKIVDDKTVEVHQCIGCNQTFDKRFALERHAICVHSDLLNEKVMMKAKKLERFYKQQENIPFS